LLIEEEEELNDHKVIVRTIEGTPPILPFSWRTFVYSGGDVCHVEIGYMNN
jgi:hypothetical protein